jgi:predicted nucleic acid-binding Zn ribbon protein
MKMPVRKFKCLDCGHEFEVPFGIPKWNLKCEKCNSPNIVRVDVGVSYQDMQDEQNQEGENMRNGAGWIDRFWGWCRGFGRRFGRGRGYNCGRGWQRGQGWGRGRKFRGCW